MGGAVSTNTRPLTELAALAVSPSRRGSATPVVRPPVHPLFRLRKLGYATLALAAHICTRVFQYELHVQRQRQLTSNHPAPQYTHPRLIAIHRTHPLNQGLDRRPVRLRFIVLIEAEEDFVARRGGRG